MSSNRPLVWGLDISSTKTGLCYGRPGAPPKFESVAFARDDDDSLERGRRALRWAIDRSGIETPNWAYIEAPLPMMGGKTNADTALLLKGLYLLIGSVLMERRVKVRSVHLQTVRKHFIGHANLKGELAKPLVRRQCMALGWQPNNFDEADAAAVWSFGAFQIAPDLHPKPAPMSAVRVAA